MENKELKITVPEGYCIDEENSTFECIKFKLKEVTYENVAREIFKGKYFYINQFGDIDYVDDNRHLNIQEANNAASKKQLEKLLAINKLMTVAKYLNDGWKPNWTNVNEGKYCITLRNNKIEITRINTCCSTEVYFKSIKLAEQAVDILGKETIKLALSTDY